MGENKNVSHAEFEKAVREARSFVQNYDKVRWKIVDLALRVCDYSHGGRKGKSTFTVAKFAEEIEIQKKTLYQWIRVKRLVYDKLPKGVRDKVHKYNYQDIESVSDVVDENTTTSEVKRRWEEQLGRNPDEKKFEKYAKQLNAVLYNVSRPMLMKDIPEHLINLVIEKCTLITSLSKKELALRERFSGIAREAKRMNIKKEIAEGIL